MTAYDAIQIALEQYDREPNAKDPRKLYSTEPVDLIAVAGQKLEKHFDVNKLVDIRLGELLALGVLGVFYQNKLNLGFKAFVGVDSTQKNTIENSLGDGAIIPIDGSSGMSVQEVSAQNISGQNKGIEILEEVIRVMKKKESERYQFPKKCALLVDVYALSAGIDFNKIKNECDLKTFDMYFLVFYLLPDLQQCMVVHLEKDKPSNKVPILLVRDPLEYIDNIT